MRGFSTTLCLCCLFLMGHVWADERASIVADRISYSREANELLAVGTVEVYFRQFVLQAHQLRYKDGIINADGPLIFTDGSHSVAVADYGQLDENFKRAVLQGVEILVNNRIHVAASEMATDSPRYTLLRNTYVTLCRTCQKQKTPLWHFSSRATVIDRQEELVHLRDAQFFLNGTPVMWLPYLRLPATTAKRKSGLLPPKIEYSSSRGWSSSLPYFQTLGNHADITLAPLINNHSHHRLDVEFRRRFSRGQLTLKGSVTPESEGHLSAEGQWGIGDDFKLTFEGTELSQPDYFQQSGISDDNVLLNRIGVTRRKTASYFEYETRQLMILDRETHDNSHPHLVHELGWRGRVSPTQLGGQVNVDLQALYVGREPPEFQGRNSFYSPRQVQRFSSQIDWQRRWHSDFGVIVTSTLLASAQSYHLSQDAALTDNNATQFSGAAALDFSLPMVRSVHDRDEFLEPFVYIAWSPEFSDPDETIPNEDSRLVEFDMTSLRSVDRFAGHDRHEVGTRISAGVKHTTRVENRYELELGLGRIFRDRDRGQFTEASGLSGSVSNIAASAELKIADRVSLKQSLLVDDDLSISMASSRFDYRSKRFDFDFGFTTQAQDSDEGMSDKTRSLIVGAGLGLKKGWGLVSDASLDLNRKAESKVGLSLEYHHQCLDLSAKIERTLASDTVMEPSNSFSVLVSLGDLSSSAPKSSSACVGG